MPQPLKQKKILPLFRQDLKLFEGPSEADGSPTFTLYDPVRAQYFKVSWTESLVIKLLKPGMTMDDLIKAIERNSTLKVTPEELSVMFQDAMVNNLLSIARPSEVVSQEHARRRTGWFLWLVYHYLFIRVPLFHPDKFLTRTLPYVKPFFSKTAFYIYGSLILLGLLQLLSRLPEYLHTFTYFFSVEGFFFYAISISFVKIIHEFSHAYVAKYKRIHVPSMGIAFIVFWPVLFTDVTDSWKLAKRSDRIAISVAGVLAELVLAGISTLGWALSPPGMLQSTFFVISSVTWISTLVVNMNPAMRYDGYYIFSDLVQVDNLQPRSFALTRWQLRKWLLGIDVAPPETNLSHRKKWIMIGYAIYTWIYRVFLYTAIAIFIYYKFTKILGIFLFLIEIGVFLLWPIGSELLQLIRLSPYIKPNPRIVVTLTFAALLLVWLLIPLPHNINFPAVSVTNKDQVVYVPLDSMIQTIYIQRNEKVSPGKKLVQLESPPLDTEIASTEIDRDIAQKDILIASQTEEDRPLVAEKKATLASVEEKLSGLRSLKEELLLKSDINGTISQWEETLATGESVSKDQVLGKIADLNSMKIVGFVPETYVSDLKVGQSVLFFTLGSLEKFTGHIVKITPERTSVLIYPQLGSTNGGPLPVEPETKNNQLVLVESYYMVTCIPDTSTYALRNGEMGEIRVEGAWHSYLVSLWRWFESLVWREVTV